MMLDKSAALVTVLGRAEKLPVGRGLDLRTYKRDRSVAVVRRGGDSFEVREDGFEKRTHETTLKGLKKLLKTLLKREFPRSRKIRLYPLSTGEDPRG